MSLNIKQKEQQLNLSFIYNAPRCLFFTGKGGVGKTTIACATALLLADQGKRVLLVSTDPASNLQHVFEADIGDSKPTPVPGADNLYALNIDPERAAESYRDRVIGPARSVLPENKVQELEEQLSGACTTEIAAFDEFTLLLTKQEKTAMFDHIVFDTAPTGHTLRLLSLPRAWSSFLDANTSGASCLGPLSGLEKQHSQYAAAVKTLGDDQITKLILVSRPQRSALGEAARTSVELSALQVNNQHLIINGLMPSTNTDDPLAQALARRDAAALAGMPDTLHALQKDYIFLQPHNLTGVEALRTLISGKESASLTPETHNRAALSLDGISPLCKLADEIEGDGHGLLMVMGKGGVGKTTLASAIAIELAKRGNEVDLITTDPAAHLTETVTSEIDGLTIGRVDPAVETERYREHVMETKGKDLDEAGRALLEEDLRSPCTEEIAVFQAFSKAIRASRRKFVVLDTAPTGHTLLLLDATGAYHREITRHQGKSTRRVITPMMRLQDPKHTKMLLVTLPETTPVLEAAALQKDLQRAGIEPWAWIINASLAAAGPTDSLLKRRAWAEIEQIEKVRKEHAKRLFLVPWPAEEPTGTENLGQLMDFAHNPSLIS